MSEVPIFTPQVSIRNEIAGSENLRMTIYCVPLFVPQIISIRAVFLLNCTNPLKYPGSGVLWFKK